MSTPTNKCAQPRWCPSEQSRVAEVCVATRTFDSDWSNRIHERRSTVLPQGSIQPPSQEVCYRGEFIDPTSPNILHSLNQEPNGRARVNDEVRNNDTTQSSTAQWPQDQIVQNCRVNRNTERIEEIDETIHRFHGSMHTLHLSIYALHQNMLTLKKSMEAMKRTWENIPCFEASVIRSPTSSRWVQTSTIPKNRTSETSIYHNHGEDTKSRKRKRNQDSITPKSSRFYRSCRFCGIRNHVRSKQCKNTQCGKLGWKNSK